MACVKFPLRAEAGSMLDFYIPHLVAWKGSAQHSRRQPARDQGEQQDRTVRLGDAYCLCEGDGECFAQFAVCFAQFAPCLTLHSCVITRACLNDAVEFVASGTLIFKVQLPRRI